MLLLWPHFLLLSVISSQPLSVLNSSRVLFINIQVLVSIQRTPFVALRTRKLPLVLRHFLSFFLFFVVVFCLFVCLFWGSDYSFLMFTSFSNKRMRLKYVLYLNLLMHIFAIKITWLMSNDIIVFQSAVAEKSIC